MTFFLLVIGSYNLVANRRTSLGFPDTKMVKFWLNSEERMRCPPEVIPEMKGLKNLEIPVLEDYTGIPDEDFWVNFPKRELPCQASTRVDINKFRQHVEDVKERMSNTEVRRADRTLNDLTAGASSYQKGELPPLWSENSKSATDNGALLTDTIATWVKKGFVAGPFDTPPMAGFRANPLAVVVRNGKVRPILNMSGPKGRSFNDNVDKSKLEKLHMGTAKNFGFDLKRAGKGAKFSKFDLQDAYKLMPARKEDFKLQGFCWLGKCFVETQQGFGGVPSPCNFDKLAKTKDTVVCIKSGTPRSAVHRALDDSPCVARAGSNIVEKFSVTMKEICKDVNIPLAENCALGEKAFELQTRGVVLGVGFDSSNLTWFLSKEKSEKVIRRCLETAEVSHVNLKTVEKLMGSVNDLSQMCKTISFHKRAGNMLLRSFQGNYNIVKMVPADLKEELRIIARIAGSSTGGLPLAEERCQPTLSKLVFYTDAAGASFSQVKGEKVFHNNNGKGVACIGGESVADIWCWCRMEWPEGLLTSIKDEKGCDYGSKSTTLEAVGMLLPFVSCPEKVKGKNVVFMIDNLAVLYGWYKGHVAKDKSASEVLKSVHYLSGLLGTTVNVEHVDRVSNEMAELADELSRRGVSKCWKAREAMEKTGQSVVTGYLLKWLTNPVEEKNLCQKLVNELMEKFP